MDAAVLKIMGLSKAHNLRALTQLVSVRTMKLVHGESVLREAPLASQAKYRERRSKATRDWIRELLAGGPVEDPGAVERFKAKRDRQGEGRALTLRDLVAMSHMGHRWGHTKVPLMDGSACPTTADGLDELPPGKMAS